MNDKLGRISTQANNNHSNSLFSTKKASSLNNTNTINDSQPPNKRRKIKIACENCRTKKKKCDGRKPVCSTCKLNYDKKLIHKFKNNSDFKNLPMSDCKYRSEEGFQLANTDKSKAAPDKHNIKGNALVAMSNSVQDSYGEHEEEYYPFYNEDTKTNNENEFSLTPSVNMASNLQIPPIIPPINSSVNKLKKRNLFTLPLDNDYVSNSVQSNSQTLSEHNVNNNQNSGSNLDLNLDQIMNTLKELSNKYNDNDIISIISRLDDYKFNQEYIAGYWDRSLERILRWPIFEGKFESSNCEIKQIMKRKKRVVLNEIKLVCQTVNNHDTGNENCGDEIDDTKLESIIFHNLLQWIDDFIMNVHTSGNLFIDINLLRSTCDSLIDSYNIFQKEVTSSGIQNRKKSFFRDIVINSGKEKSDVINTVHVENNDNNKDNDDDQVMPGYIILIIVSISLMSWKYNAENPRISNFNSSLEERRQNGKDKLAFQIYKLSKEIFENNNTNEFYSIWKIQYKLLLSMFKNYFLKPIEAWNHIYEASSLMIMFLELNKNGNNINSQLIQRIYWQCYKNECELKFYLSPMFMSSGILTYKPPFKVKDLKIPPSINTEPLVIKDGWAFYLTEIFIRPILNKIMNRFYGISVGQNGLNNTQNSMAITFNGPNIEKKWQSLNQNDYIGLIQSYLKETGKLLIIFEKFLTQQKLSTPLRCADERVIRIKECLFIPLLYHISTIVPLPLPNYSTHYESQIRHINYQDYLNGYLISFIKDICDQYLKIPDLVEFSSERRHGSWFRLRDIFLSCILLMIIYKKFGIYFFEKKRLQLLIDQTNKIYNYWKDECIEFEYLMDVINSIYSGLPYINEQ